MIKETTMGLSLIKTIGRSQIYSVSKDMFLAVDFLLSEIKPINKYQQHVLHNNRYQIPAGNEQSSRGIANKVKE